MLWLQAFAGAVALRLFVLRTAADAAALSTACAAAAAGLASAASALEGYVRQFMAVARAAAAAAESHALLQRCEATLGGAAEQERVFAAEAGEARAALEAVRLEAAPLAAQAAACLQECQASWE
jgi:hypothetical protein